jgi:hypothetical protein
MRGRYLLLCDRHTADSRRQPLERAAAGLGLGPGARDLSGRDGILFRRNSVTGALEALPRTAAWGELNAVLHAND